MNSTQCPDCHRPLNTSSGVSLLSKTGKCVHCNLIFDLIDQKVATSLVSTPKEVEKLVDEHGPVIKYEWKTNKMLVLIFLVIAGLCSVVGYEFLKDLNLATYSDLMNKFLSYSYNEPMFWGVIFCPSLTLIFGYMTLCNVFNRTEIRSEEETIVKKSGPFFWSGGSRKIQRKSIKQVYIRRYSTSGEGAGLSTRYKLVVQTKYAKQFEIVGNLPTLDFAKNIQSLLVSPAEEEQLPPIKELQAS